MPRAESARVPGGFTLIEALLILMLTAVMAAVAYPSFRSQMLKARRTDALIALMQLQQGQERWRAAHLRYGSGDELSAPARSPQGHYRLRVVSADPSGFELEATALDGQQNDTRCRVLRISRQRGETRYLAGTASGGVDADSDPVHRECWAR